MAQSGCEEAIKEGTRIKKSYFQLDTPKGASASFTKHAYQLMDPTITLIQYLGDEKVAVEFAHGNAKHNPEQRTATQSQIVAIMCCPDTSITLKVEKTQFQKGGSDCGLFATDLCHGNNPASYRYDQDKLRSHLLECLRLKKMTPFPSQLHRPGRPQTEHIRVYCSCHLPDHGKEKMAACDRCAEWYHISCENIPKAVVKNSGTFWICSKCVQKN